MAASADPLFLECKLCDKTYQHKDGPLMLPCLHSFCKPCLLKYFEKEESADNKMMACPTCNDRFPLPKNINQLPVNLRLSHLAEATMYEKQAEGGKVKCQKCKGTPKADATSFCCNHCKFVCEQCQDDYLRFCENEELEFIDLDKFKKGEFKVHAPPSKCSEHPKQDMVLFCEQPECTCLICLVCSQSEHQTHPKRSIDKTAEKEKKSLQEATNGVDDALHVMDQTFQQIQEMRDKVKVSAKQATNRINKMCNALIQAVENRREVLKRRCQEIAEGKDDVLSNQMVEVDKLRRKLEYAKLHARDATSKSTPEELLSVKKVIKSCLNRSMKIYQQQLVTEVEENDVINTSLKTDSVVQEIKNLGHFPGVPDANRCLVEGLAVPVAIIGKERTVRVVLKDEAGNLVQQDNCHFQYKLSKPDEDPTDQYIPPKVSIIPGNDDGMVTLGFTPDKPGVYELTVMVRNKPIGASPYQITAREPRDYKGFGNTAAIKQPIGVGGNCLGIAVHDNGTVYTTNNSKIKVFNPDGTAEGEIGDENLSRTWGITLIGDTIYVVSSNKHMVYMYSTIDRQCTGEFGGNGSGDGQLSNPLGICTDGNDRVLVADQSNNRIQVFSADGNFIESIKCSSYPYDVAVDTIGNIHVALYSEHKIAVYSPHTRLEIDGSRYNIEGNTGYPSGIYIDGEGNRVIGSCGNSRVIIADPRGAYLDTKQINSCTVTMDKKGQVYIAEYGNNRWSVY